MNKKIADLILQWHGVYVALGNCIESARVVLDQSDRGTLLPDRVREMRGELLDTQLLIPQLADLMEELIGMTTWPMKVEGITTTAPEAEEEEAEEEAAEVADASPEDAPGPYSGDYDAAGATPVEEAPADEEAAAEEVSEADDAYGEPDATGTP